MTFQSIQIPMQQKLQYKTYNYALVAQVSPCQSTKKIEIGLGDRCLIIDTCSLSFGIFGKEHSEIDVSYFNYRRHPRDQTMRDLRVIVSIFGRIWNSLPEIAENRGRARCAQVFGLARMY